MKQKNSRDFDEHGVTADTIFLSEAEGPKWSGLYDKDGRKLYRPKEPVGFDPKRWERE